VLESQSREHVEQRIRAGALEPRTVDVLLRTFEREYAFGRLGILADVAPSSDELVFVHHERGFALLFEARTALDGWTLRTGPVLEKGVTGMRSFVAEPMQHGPVFHGYSRECLRRVWRAEHFSWWITSMLHRLPGDDPFESKLQLAQLRYVTTSQAATPGLAETYVGLGAV